jgi:hypothetical protein
MKRESCSSSTAIFGIEKNKWAENKIKMKLSFIVFNAAA